MIITIEEILTEWKEDALIDEAKLSFALTRTPLLHAKYVEYYAFFKRKLASAEAKKSKLAYIKRKYYRGEMTLEELKKHEWNQYQGLKPSATELNQLLDFDTDMIEYTQVISEFKTAVSCIEYILNSIKTREYTLKTLFEYTKYMNGG